MTKNHKYEQIKVSDLKGYEKNARVHSAEQVQQVVNSIKEFGFTNPVLIDEENILIAGHGRTEAAKILGLEKVPAIRLNGLTDAQKKALRIADNQLALNATWDENLLAAELEEIHLENFDLDLLGFDDEFLGNLLDFETDENAAEEKEEREKVLREPKEERVKKGDIWQLGKHRLLCGDSTDLEQIKELLQGEKVGLLLTDPPYGINVVKGESLGQGLGIDYQVLYKEVKNDDSTDTAKKNYEIIKDLTENQIIFGGNYFTDFLPPRRCWIVWDKEVTAGSYADFEMAWTSFDKNAKLYKWIWNGFTRKGEIKEEGKGRCHPTQKPVGLFKEIIKDFSGENDLVLDCFAGSGTTLLACETLGRQCLAVEYEEFYCNFILERWEEMTGKKAVKIKGLDK
jgi:DNA modification methylase